MKNWQASFTLTPISPIHIGAGQDLDPTQYVIHDNLIHHYTHLQMYQALPASTLEQLGKLAENARTADDQLTLNGMIHQHKEKLAQHAAFQFLVSPALSSRYEATINKTAHTGNKSQNKLELIRHIHNPINQQAYIPGSSLKGTIRTAITNTLTLKAGLKASPKHKADAIQKELLNYEKVDQDPFKRLKISDAQSPAPIQKFQICTNYHKKAEKNSGGIPVNIETTQIGSHFEFQAQFKLYDFDRQKNDNNTFYTEPESIVADLNRFYLPQLQTQLEQWQNDKRIDSQWLKHIQSLMDNLKTAIMQNQIAIVRLGHYAGALSKSWTQLRQIENRKVKDKNDPDKYMQDTHTFWLSEDHKPLGWAIISLKNDNSDTIPALLKDFIALFSEADKQKLVEIETLKHNYAEQKRLNELEQKRLEEAQKRREQAEKEKHAKLQSMSPNQQAIFKLEETFEQEKAHNLQNPAGELRQQINNLIDQAHQQAWSPEDKETLKKLCLAIFDYWSINPKKNAKVKDKLKLLNS